MGIKALQNTILTVMKASLFAFLPKDALHFPHSFSHSAIFAGK